MVRIEVDDSSTIRVKTDQADVSLSYGAESRNSFSKIR
jgi:hypothetical protein